jgi:hypothetical protein
MICIFSNMLCGSTDFVEKVLALSADYSRSAATTTSPKCSGGNTGAIRCTGGISRANRHAKMSIRRFAPVQPPAILAGKLQNMQLMQ